MVVENGTKPNNALIKLLPTVALSHLFERLAQQVRLGSSHGWQEGVQTHYMLFYDWFSIQFPQTDHFRVKCQEEFVSTFLLVGWLLDATLKEIDYHREN